MSPPAPRYPSDEKEIYQFACPNCWAVRTITLTPGIDRPMCDCGSPLFVLGEVESEDSEYLPLDHPHTDRIVHSARSTKRPCSTSFGVRLLPEELQLRVRSTALAIAGASRARRELQSGGEESSHREGPRSPNLVIEWQPRRT